MKHNIIQLIEQKNRAYVDTSNHIFVKTGNVVRVSYKITESAKERIQQYEGLIISTQNRTNSKTFKLRRIAHGVGVEQTFPLFSPKITHIKLCSKSKVRRSKLFFIRNLQSKSKFIRLIK